MGYGIGTCVKWKDSRKRESGVDTAGETEPKEGKKSRVVSRFQSEREREREESVDEDPMWQCQPSLL